jgi:hypothetical protein
MNKIGLNLARMSWPIDYYGEGLTHSETCYTYHDACAIHRLADELEQLRDAAKTLCDSVKEQWGTGYSIQPQWGIGYSICYTIDKEKLDELRQLLPKEPQ